MKKSAIVETRRNDLLFPIGATTRAKGLNGFGGDQTSMEPDNIQTRPHSSNKPFQGRKSMGPWAVNFLPDFLNSILLGTVAQVQKSLNYPPQRLPQAPATLGGFLW